MTDPARVAIVITSLRGGGAERAIVAAVKSLDRSRFEPVLVLNELAGELLPEIDGLCRLEIIGSANISRSLPRLISTLRRVEPQLVLSHLWQWNAAVAAARSITRAPWAHVAVEHSALHRRGWVGRQLTRAVLSRADAVVAVSEAMAGDLRALHPSAHVAVVPNPVLACVDRPQRIGPRSSESFNIVAIGNLRAEKRHDVLIRAVAKLPSDYRLRVAGDGVLRAELSELIVSLGLADRVELVGYVDDVTQVLESSDLFVLSSDTEGLPTALIEAVALGVPAVATDCKHGPAEILLGGEGGLLVPTGDVDAVASAIAAVRADYQRALERASKAADVARVRYSVEGSASRVQAILEECIGKRPGVSGQAR